jgi:hypothetical protein
LKGESIKYTFTDDSKITVKELNNFLNEELKLNNEISFIYLGKKIDETENINDNKYYSKNISFIVKDVNLVNSSDNNNTDFSETN